MRFTKASVLIIFALASAISLSACVLEGVIGAVHVAEGEARHDATTVNGGVHVGDNAKVGEAATVNGGVHLGKNVVADEVRSVNGGIDIGSNTKIQRDVTTVNGHIDLDPGSDVSGDVANINGSIRLEGTHVGGGINTVNGNVDVGRGSHVERGIHVQGKHSGIDFNRRLPRIVIGPGATVNGTLRFDREVKLYVSDTATIGRVEGATPIRFSGDQPDDQRTASADEREGRR
jgi:acetyltransferase-like isoleucine patch superfamily enzyme